jgi:uncharacterized protein (DUF2147 family)
MIGPYNLRRFKWRPSSTQNFRRALIAALLLLSMQPLQHVHADEQVSLTGLWETYDDHTGKARAVVRIYAEQGQFFGRIEKTFVPGDDTAVCEACTDERKNQPVLGLIIIRNMKREGGSYAGGDILEPDSGAVYRCTLQLENDGSQLVVRGFIGISLFGRSQTWQRVK